MLKNWLMLSYKFPKSIDADLLKTLYANYHQIQDSTKQLAIPDSVCHGDFHPNNILKNGDRLMLCDWQNACIGKDIGDISFFISRGTDMGIEMNKEEIIRTYHSALTTYLNQSIDIKNLYLKMAESEFSVSFKYWAEYLQDSSLERVLKIYSPMVESYALLKSAFSSQS